MSIGLKVQSIASVPTPPAGEQNIFIDSADDKYKKKMPSGAVVDLEAMASGVATFNGRTGFVVSEAGDYQASQVDFTPAGSLTSADVQAAIEELDAEKAPITHVGAAGTGAHPVADGSTAGFMSPSDKTKIDSIAFGATANDTNANLRDRATHTGSQLAGTISDFGTAALGVINAQKGIANGLSELDASSKVPLAQIPDITASKVTDFDTQADSRIAAQKGAANGITPLGVDSKVPAVYLPSYVDDVEEYANLASFPVSGETGKIYVAVDTGKIYRWSGSIYVEISPSPSSTDSVVEGSSNLYFTDTRARTAVVDDAIVDGVTNKAPSQNAVFDALALKSNMLSLVGEVVASGSGAVNAVMSNAAVIAKVLTGFTVTFGIIDATDSILTAIQKLAGRSALSPNTINVDMTIPAGYTWIRQDKTVLDDGKKITIESGGKLTII